MQHIIGQVSLNVSFVLYLFLCLPQVIHNKRYKKTQGLSLLMHTIFFSSYLTDLIYGFGLGMPWQYKTVTLCGILCLFVQHVQLARYQKLTRQYVMSSLILLLLMCFTILTVIAVHLSINGYNTIGLIAQLLAVIYLFPQIVKNYHIKDAFSVSVGFLLIEIASSCLDTVSAFALQWNYPSKIGPPVIIACGLIVLLQYYYYNYRYNKCVI